MSSDCCPSQDTPTSACCGSDTDTTHQQHDSHRQQVRDAYAKVAQSNNEGDACGIESSCCGVSDDESINTLISTRLAIHRKNWIRRQPVPTWAWVVVIQKRLRPSSRAK